MHRLKQLVPQAIKNLYHLAQAFLANTLYGFPARNASPARNDVATSGEHSDAGGPSRQMKVIGITGTNGKTTTVQMAVRILEAAGKKVAMISTINFKIGEKEWVNKTKYTTLSPFATQKFIREALEAGCEYLVLETSSHSLDQYRVWGIDYKTAVMTNVTREHLDYHMTMETYRKAKEKLFAIVAKGGGTVIVNLDMEKPEQYLQYAKGQAFAYSAAGKSSEKPGLQTIKAQDVELGINQSKFKISHAGQDANFSLNIPGAFNVENALAAVCVGLSEKIGLEKISEALAGIKNVPGRLESVSNRRGLNIIIDYAVTPDSLGKLYALIRQINVEKKKVIAVFGSCGERDKGKRPLMGEIVSRYADYVLVTNEDPYYEDPDHIIEEVAAGVKGRIENENFWKISDRREAISKALTLAEKGDFVIVTGKGAEETMAVGNERIPWNDKQVIVEELEKLR